jgi:pyruvate,water dikinase
MSLTVIGLWETDKTQRTLVGGKGAALGELAKIQGIHVPDGFCITTAAYRRIVGETPGISELVERISLLRVEEREQIRELSGEVRRAIEGTAIPQEIEEEIGRYLARYDEQRAYAVRSSATAEDLPTASFAGQQDTYLNVVGKAAVLAQVRKCWASLFSERAVTYRRQHGFDPREVALAVVVQKMVLPQAAGILFTADPVTGNRKVVAIDAGFGLGEAVVAGLANADSYRVREGKLIDKKIGNKQVANYARREGGTQVQAVEAAAQNRQVLTDAQILELAEIGRRIEAHFGAPQDIEWCLADDTFAIVQSRPITTLYPVPEVNDQAKHVYISVGHQQMMTDPLKPLGLSFFRLTAGRPMYPAGGRLFVDIGASLASPATRNATIAVLGQSEPLIKDALTTLVARGDFFEAQDEADPMQGKPEVPLAGLQAQGEIDPGVVAEVIARRERSLAELRRNIQAKAGPELFDFILEDLQVLSKSLADPQIIGVILAAMNAAAWLNEKMREWLGEKNAADVLSQSLSNNVTSAMGLALADVADVMRPYPEVVEYLQQAKDDDFLNALVKLEGGQEAREAMEAFLQEYGMRGVGEIDITRLRWRDKPSALVPMILSNIRNLAPQAARRRFEQGRQEALEKEQELLARLRELPEGELKAAETQRRIDCIRNFAGYREYPKYHMICRYFVYRQALREEAARLVQAKVMREEEDMYFLTFEELREVVRTQRLDGRIVEERKEEYKHFEKLMPPRVMTADGEIMAGKYRGEHLPAGALAGLAVSSGVVEGRARVLVDVEDAALEDGDILVTRFTDPSWTPLFMAIRGLVTEVGGLMTHGAVIAREYGLPAVVGVQNATKLIQDGQRIRVDGTEGYVEIL